ncbi:MAG: stage 0 sporulation family protein [Deltaproteobacteria bacterium]|nr:stage 0 sporulation family protein [Deltaproteobacteria bacterium]
MVKIVGVRFKKACKVYDFEANELDLNPNDSVIVEVEKGLGMGVVVYKPREVDPDTVQRQLKKVVRKADVVDTERHGFNTERENEAFRICREKIAHYKLPMKLIRVEYLFDSSKAIFYFTSETRVDFRELVKDLASGFHTRIEMRQIGVRDEAKMIGGLGPCGRELCCSGFLSDFEPVTIKMAKEQNLALNPVKISGICGRLMCCLSYEHDMYQGEKRDKNKENKDKDKDKDKTNDKDGCGGCGKHGNGHVHSHEQEQGQQQPQGQQNQKQQPQSQQPQKQRHKQHPSRQRQQPHGKPSHEKRSQVQETQEQPQVQQPQATQEKPAQVQEPHVERTQGQEVKGQDGTPQERA